MNKHEYELNEKMFDQFLTYAAEQSIEKMTFPSDEELKKTVTFSPEFEKKMKRLLKRAKFKDRFSRHKVISKKVKHI